MNIKFKRSAIQRECKDCGCSIEKTAPYFAMVIGEENVDLCEDCGNELQNTLSEVYCEFSDLKK